MFVTKYVVEEHGSENFEERQKHLFHAQRKELPSAWARPFTKRKGRVWSSEGECAVQDPRIPGENAVLMRTPNYHKT